MSRTPYERHRWGMVAELLCILWLLCKGYTVLAWRYRSASGEIDIVARAGRQIICIEVKARTALTDALEAVTASKRILVMQAAEQYLKTHPRYRDHSLRFDVMVVRSWHQLRHFKDAWRAA